jgi:hypothetical protein
MDKTPKLALFRLGQVVATPGALSALERAGDTPQQFLERHVPGNGATSTKMTDKKMP